MTSPLRPGARNAITDVAGLRVGQAQDADVRSGVTVLLPTARAVAAVDVRGGGSGTRETDLLKPGMTVESIDALVFSGGSAYGLDAASGVHAWIAERGGGLDVGSVRRVPIVPSAILFDLSNGGDKDWGITPPYRDLGIAACEAADMAVDLGTVGAGYGAVAGDLAGGLGTASLHDPTTGTTVGALAAVNSFGCVTDPDGVFYAWPVEMTAEFGGRRPSGRAEDLEPRFPKLAQLGTNTTLVAVATDAALTRQQLHRIAVMAQDGLARAIRPVHTPFDGDSLFALSTGTIPVPDGPLTVARIGALAADTVARAIARGVYEGRAIAGVPSWMDRFGS